MTSSQLRGVASIGRWYCARLSAKLSRRDRSDNHILRLQAQERDGEGRCRVGDRPNPKTQPACAWSACCKPTPRYKRASEEGGAVCAANSSNLIVVQVIQRASPASGSGWRAWLGPDAVTPHMTAIVLVVASTLIMSVVSLAIGFLHGDDLPAPDFSWDAYQKPWPPRWPLRL
jgi:hypothetical protein